MDNEGRDLPGDRRESQDDEHADELKPVPNEMEATRRSYNRGVLTISVGWHTMSQIMTEGKALEKGLVIMPGKTAGCDEDAIEAVIESCRKDNVNKSPLAFGIIAWKPEVSNVQPG